MLPGSVILCPEPVPGLLRWAYLEQLGLSSTTSGLVLGDSICPRTNGVSLLHRIASVAPLSKLQTMSNSVLYTYIGHHMEHNVGRFWMTKLDAGLMTSLPASDLGSATFWCSKRIKPRPQSCLCLTWSGCPSNDDDDEWKRALNQFRL